MIVQEALKRLPPRVLYDRVYRIRRAAHLSMAQKILPKSQWTTEKEVSRIRKPSISFFTCRASRLAACGGDQVVLTIGSND